MGQALVAVGVVNVECEVDTCIPGSVAEELLEFLAWVANDLRRCQKEEPPTHALMVCIIFGIILTTSFNIFLFSTHLRQFRRMYSALAYLVA
mmetsp:Transcript_67883/g.106801  ORF Transcript_67883/g.106801 Transcript_67883/m.106801 type:complete len:92 (-) Transcript_67883:9-284(-)